MHDNSPESVQSYIPDARWAESVTCVGTTFATSAARMASEVVNRNNMSERGVGEQAS